MTELRLFTAFGMRGMRRLQSLGDQKQFRLSLAPPPLGYRRENRSTQAERAAEGGRAVRATSGTAFTRSPVRICPASGRRFCF